MSFEKAMGKMKFDTRLLEYNFSQGYISKSEYDKHLLELDDCAHLVAPPSETLAADDDDDLDEGTED